MEHDELKSQLQIFCRSFRTDYDTSCTSSPKREASVSDSAQPALKLHNFGEQLIQSLFVFFDNVDSE